MSGPSADDLRTVLDKYVEGATWAVAMAAVGRKEKTIFNWLQKSKRAEVLKQLDGPFFLRWNSDDGDDLDEPADWFHVHLKAAARARRTIVYETILVNQAVHGIEEIIRDGNGRIVWQENPKTVGKDDDQLIMENGNADRLRRDEAGNPMPAVRVTQLPATLRQAIIRGLMPGVYGDHATVDIQSKSQVIVQHQFLRRPSTPAEALPPPKIESDLVRDLREKLQAGVKNPKPNGRVEILGRATGDAPDKTSTFPTDVPPTPRNHPRSYEVPAPTPAPPPDFSRPQAGEQINRPGIGSRSAPPAGGFRVR